MNIQKLRLQRGWSQQQLAELSGLSARTIQRLENGQPASTESLKSLASVFEIDFSTLSSEQNMSTHTNLQQDEQLALTKVRKCRIPDDCIDTGRYPLFIAGAAGQSHGAGALGATNQSRGAGALGAVGRFLAAQRTA